MCRHWAGSLPRDGWDRRSACAGAGGAGDSEAPRGSLVPRQASSPPPPGWPAP